MKRYYNNRNTEPRELTARFASKCAETGKAINKGDTCVYYPANKTVYHMDSKTAEAYRSQAFADAWCLGDANW